MPSTTLPKQPKKLLGQRPGESQLADQLAVSHSRKKTAQASIGKQNEAIVNVCPASAQLLQADSLEAGILADESVDLIVTSPPYNVGKPYSGAEADDSLTYKEYEDFSRRWLKNCYSWTRSTGRLCVNVSLDKNKNGKQPLSADVTRWAMDAGWLYHATIIWNENNISRRTAWGSWKSASAPHVIAPVETIIVLYKNSWKRENKGQDDITGEEFKDWVLGSWSFNGESAKRVGHEAPFPKELPKRCIKLFSFVGDTVLDPFSGSGTTMIEALNNDRNSIGIELEPKHCQTSIRRIEKECGQKLMTLSPAKQGKSIGSYWAT